MNIRPFEEKDRSSVINLWQEAGLVKPQNDPNRDIDRKLLVGRDLFLVGEVDGRVVATVMGGYEGHRGWVNYLAVAQGHRRKGMGKRMMATLECRLKEKGCPKLNLQVRQSNAEVIAFYKALGYGRDEVVSLGKRLVPD